MGQLSICIETIAQSNFRNSNKSNKNRFLKCLWVLHSLIYTDCLFQVDRLEDELVGEQEKFKAITEELEQTFAEMSGY